MYSSINGTRLFYDTEGSALKAFGDDYQVKPTLIMLHGGPGSDHSYSRPSLSALSESAYVVYLDQRNQGRSQRENFSTFSLSQLSSDLNEFCRINSIENPYIFGHSFGGMVAIEYASQYRENIGGLILCASFSSMKYSAMFSMFEKLGGAAARKAAESFWLEPSEETLELYKREAIACTSRNWPNDISLRNKRCRPNSELCVHFWSSEGKTFNLVQKLQNVNCKTLIISGDSDPVSPPECSEEIGFHIGSGLSETLLLENCGHMFWYDQPQIGITAIKQFLTSEQSNA